MTETLYVGTFTNDNVPITHTEQGPEENRLPAKDGRRPNNAPFPRAFNFTISHLAHSTHAEEKNGICSIPGRASFIAKPKGRSRACGQAVKLKYEAGEWKQIPGENLYPGQYVWFAMKPTLPQAADGFNEADYPVPYVNGTTFYGPWSFTFGYSELIKAYKAQIPEGADVVLKNGGTLRYRKELCYVVIVTYSRDGTHAAYPTLATTDVLKLGDDYTAPLTFHPRCVPPPYPAPPQWRDYDLNQLGHYDHVAFAVHCDWDGNHFEIVLPAGQPYCFFSDHDTKDAYYKHHPICLPMGTDRQPNGQYYPKCYGTERRLWIAEQAEEAVDDLAIDVENLAV